MEHCLCQSIAYRNIWPEPDVSLELLRKVLFSFFGVEESSADEAAQNEKMRRIGNPQDGAAASMSTGATLTGEEAEAYVAAGMPSPFTGWLKGFRNERRRRESPPDSGP